MTAFGARTTHPRQWQWIPEKQQVSMPAESPVALAAHLGLKACASLSQDNRRRLGQFFTPPALAALMASMFESAEGDVRLLDPGAGFGVLTAAFVEEALGRARKPKSLHLTAWEVEGKFVAGLERVLNACVKAGRGAGVPTTYSIKQGDMLSLAVLDQHDPCSAIVHPRSFTHSLSNPPYRKIKADSEARLLLRHEGLETTNLYAGFLWLTARLLGAEGQMVAITPRSYCNGPYFLPFRERFFGLMALKRFHVFHRRDALFTSDDVLQENLIMYAHRSEKDRRSVLLSSSDGLPAEGGRSRTVAYSRVIDPSDPKHVVHVPVELDDNDVQRTIMDMPMSLASLGIEASTGRVVEFRARPFLRENVGIDTAPLIHPLHLNNGSVRWPCRGSRKPNNLVVAPGTKKLLVANGVYVLVKRFTTKEEPRRLVAAVYRPEGNSGGFASVGFENHLNYFHCRGGPIEETLAEGLARYLNSTLVDSYFRQFSGHTQVNASDLRSLRYPSKDKLCKLAKTFSASLNRSPE
jgi:adenine-specific DNA-methyltransferase